jgi:DNA-binding transcriptional regulator YdaS (Cro superfamily)
METALERAIAAAGGPVAIAKLVGVSSQAVSQWERIPAKHCMAIETATGIPCHEQRPDIFPKPSTPVETGESAGA